MANRTCSVEGLGIIDKHFWKNKRVLITGHTGFKGAWLSIWLKKLGAQVAGVALPPNTTPNLFAAALEGEIESYICDIRNFHSLITIIQQIQPEIVFHLAAQSLVRASYRDPVSTFATNVMGTVHVLEAIRQTKCVRSVIMVTTDKVYRNNEWPYPYRENDPLGGYDPYSASKAASEMAIDSYRLSFLAPKGTAVASVRAGNVIGGGDWAEDRIIPDAVRAWESGRPLLVRNPESVRPWQHVLEPLYGYLLLAQKLWVKPELAGPFNFGPHTDEAIKVKELIELARVYYGEGEIIYSVSSAEHAPHEAGLLALEIAKARNLIGFRPKWRLEEAVKRTVHWYKEFYKGKEAKRLCYADITVYEGEDESL